jgi:hypothetical protein
MLELWAPKTGDADRCCCCLLIHEDGCSWFRVVNILWKNWKGINERQKRGSEALRSTLQATIDNTPTCSARNQTRGSHKTKMAQKLLGERRGGKKEKDDAGSRNTLLMNETMSPQERSNWLNRVVSLPPIHLISHDPQARPISQYYANQQEFGMPIANLRATPRSLGFACELFDRENLSIRKVLRCTSNVLCLPSIRSLAWRVLR